MNHQQEVFFVAGEPSGDVHAAGLARALTEIAAVRLTGAGGPRMRNAGVVTDFDSANWGTVGLPDAIRRIPGLLRQGRRMANLIRQRQPDLLLLVDFGAFNVRLARAVRQTRPQQRIMYYFPPASWRRKRRDWSFLGELVDVVATPFKWSAAQLRASGVRAYWVGHPVVERFSSPEDPAQFRRERGLPDATPVIGLMPGSRPVERNCIGPQLLGAARLLHRSLPEAHFLWSLWNPDRPNRSDRQAMASSYITPLADSRTLILASDLVAGTSGTATLECAAALRPLIMVYRGTWATVLQFRLTNLGTDCYAMPNIIAQRMVVPELIQNDVNPQRLAKEVLDLYTNKARYNQMKQDLAEIRAELGPPGASQRAAELAVALMTGASEMPTEALASAGEGSQ